METKKYQINNVAGVRVDVYLSEQLNFTRSRVKKLCDDGALTVNGKLAKSNKIVKSGDEVEIVIPENKSLDLEPQNIPLKIVYQDDDLAIIDYENMFQTQKDISQQAKQSLRYKVKSKPKK
jgi:23S rRNA pseudouridine1911/1915/1917 synthase